MRRGWPALLAILAACGEPEPPREERPVFEGGTGPLDTLVRRFGRLRNRMEGRGYGDSESATRVFLPEGEGRGFALDLPTDRCTTMIAIGGGRMRELDARLFDGEGAELAQDAIDGEGALLHVCPEGAAGTLPHYLELRAERGAGAVVIGAFHSPHGAGEGFGDLFDEVLDPAVGFEDVEAALAATTRVLRDRGMRAEGEARVVGVAEGEAVRQQILLEPGRCYVGVAQGGEGLRDVDLYLFDGAGAELARDIGGDATPRVEHCPSVEGVATLEAQAFEGAGAIALAVFSGAPVDDEEPPPAPETQDGLDAFEPLPWLLAQADVFSARGYGDPLLLVREATIAPGETAVHEVVVGPGCAVVLGAGGPGELDLDLYLADPEGELVDRDVRVARTATVAACSPSVRTYEVRVKGYGRGRYALARLAAAPELDELAALRVEPSLADHRRRGFELVRSARVELSSERPLRERFEVPEGRCAVALAGGGEGVLDLDLLLRDEAGTLLATDTGPAPWAALGQCGGAGPLEIELRVYRGEGEAVLQWLEGPDS